MLPAPGQHNSGTARVNGRYAASDADASTLFDAPPRYTHHKSKRVVAEYIPRVAYVDEHHPLLAQPKPNCDRQPKATCFSLLIIPFIIFLLCPLLYLIIPGPSDAVDYKSLYQAATANVQRLTTHNAALEKEVTHYKDMYEDSRVRAGHLEQENAALEGKIHGLQTNLHDLRKEVTLYKEMYEDIRVRAVHLAQENTALEGEIHDLQTKLHDLRGHLANSKVLAFWEIARTMNTNMYVLLSPPLTPLMVCLRDSWVGADDIGWGPKFWSYGITNGLFNDNDPAVTSTKHHFADRQAVIIESTEHRRIVGYKVESNRRNNGWWFATGLIEFGQSGLQEVKFSAKPANKGAEYEVTVYYADWKL